MFLSSSWSWPLGGILFTIISASGQRILMSWIRESSCWTTCATGCPLAMSFPAHCSTTAFGLKFLKKMAGTLSLKNESSDPGYLKDVAENPYLDTLWARPRTREVPMMAIDGLLGTWVLFVGEAPDGGNVTAGVDGGLWPRTKTGAGGRRWPGDTALSASAGNKGGVMPSENGTELTFVRTIACLCQRCCTFTKSSSSLIPTAAKSDLAAETTWSFRSAGSEVSHVLTLSHFSCISEYS